MKITCIISMMLIPLVMTAIDSTIIFDSIAITLILGLGSYLLIETNKNERQLDKIKSENRSFHLQTEEKQHATHIALHYTANALPIHIEQLKTVIDRTESETLSLGNHFSSLLEQINENTHHLEQIKNTLLNPQTGIIHLLNTDKLTPEALEKNAISLELSRDKLSNALDSDAATTLSGNLQHLIKNNESIQTSISDIMVSLQFSDVTRQILEHVQEDLNKISNDIHQLDILFDLDNIEELIKLEENIAKRYTMESERQTFEKVTGLTISRESRNTSTEKSLNDDDITFL